MNEDERAKVVTSEIGVIESDAEHDTVEGPLNCAVFDVHVDFVTSFRDDLSVVSRRGD